MPLETGTDRMLKRSRRTAAPDEGTSALRIRVLGSTMVETADGIVDRGWLSQRPGQLLRYLASQRGRFVPADEIVEALRPGASAGAEESIRYLVHHVRRRLEPARPPRARSLAIECLGGAYALAAAVWVDVQAFEDFVEAGLQASAAGEEDVALALLDRALEMYRGDFLADEPYADWAMIERERVRGIVEDALAEAAYICERRRDLRRALEYARWLAEMGKYDSDVQLRVVRLCLRCGRRGEAARRYAAFRSRLSREFGIEPEFDLASVANNERELPLPFAVRPSRMRGGDAF